MKTPNANSHSEISKILPMNNRGVSLILMICVIFIITFIMTGMLSFAAHNLQAIASYTQALETPELFENELNTVLSNDQLCSGIVKISGNNFAFQGFVEPAPSPKSTFASGMLNVISMSVSNVKALTAPLFQADLLVNYTFYNPKVNAVVPSQYSATIQYVPNGNSISQCLIVNGLQAACNGLGFQWIAAGPGAGRCGICEGSGGIWNGTNCVF